MGGSNSGLPAVELEARLEELQLELEPDAKAERIYEYFKKVHGFAD